MIGDMDNQQTEFIKLVGLSSFLEQQASLDESLDEIVAKSASLLNSKNCSIMLFREEARGEGVKLRMFAKHGDFPPKAATEAVKVNNGIAGKVAASARPLLVQDIGESEYLPLARRPDSTSKSFICVPIVIGDKVIGVLNVSNPIDNRCFDDNDLNLSVFVTLLIGRSVQVIQLQNLLKSKFAQMAVMQEDKDMMGTTFSLKQFDADQLVKMLSKSFYREMTTAGFTQGHIITAATEIISQLSESLTRHDNRSKRETNLEAS
jgi:signal transduction protein with GAF and PtsI domain